MLIGSLRSQTGKEAESPVLFHQHPLSLSLSPSREVQNTEAQKVRANFQQHTTLYVITKHSTIPSASASAALDLGSFRLGLHSNLEGQTFVSFWYRHDTFLRRGSSPRPIDLAALAIAAR